MAACGAWLIGACAVAMQAVPDAPPAPQPRQPAQEPGGWQPRFRPNPAEIVEVPAVRARRERVAASFAELVDRKVLALVKIGGRARDAAARLSDARFEVREAACRELLDRSIGDAEILAMLDRGELDDEAHARLLSVAVRRVLEMPRGALGVRMGPSPPPRPGVLVQSTLPGMPASKVLLSGDVIEALDGQPLEDPNDLVSGLQQKAPGTEIAITVLRTERDAKGKPLAGPDGKPVERRLEFRVPLGNANDLDAGDPGLPRGLGAGMNMVNEQRRMQAEFVRAHFERPLPQAVRVAPVQPASSPSPEP